MNPAVPLLVASALGAGGSLDLGVRGEGSSRWVDPAVTAGDARTVDLALVPRAALGLHDGGIAAELSYRPRVAVRDLGPDRRREVFHEGELRLRLEPRGVWRLEVFGSGATGRTDLVTLHRLAPPGQDTGTITTTSSLLVETLRAGASLRLAASGRSEWLLSAAYSAGGGADAASRVYLPTERALTTELQLGYAATRVDRVGLRITAAGSRLPDQDGESAWSTALATWRHRASRQVELSLGVGAVGFSSSFPATGDVRVQSRNARPAGEAGLTASAGERAPSATLAARLGATNDRVTGRASQSLDGSALLGWPATRWLGLRLTGSGSVSWPVGGQIRRGGVEAGATFQLSSHLHLDVGGYGTWQRSENPIAPSLAEFGALLGLSVDAPRVSW